MRNSFLTSLGLHIAILLALIVGLPHLKQKPLEIAQPIPIDVMDVGEVTTTKQQGEGNKANPDTIAPPPPPPATPEPPKQPDVPKPAPPSPQPTTKEKPQEPDKGPVIEDKTKKPPKPKEEKKKPEKKPEEQKQEFNSLLKNLTRDKSDTPPSPDSKSDAKPAPNASTGAKGLLADKLTISQEDALRRQIERCWNIPVGARDVQDMIVDVKIDVNPDRTVKSVQVVDTARMSDPFFRALAESALRALRHPGCTPLELPPDQYDLWKTITFRFNPREMLGG